MTKSDILLIIKKSLAILIIALLLIVGMSVFTPAEAIEQDKALHASGSAGIAYIATKHYDDPYSPFALSLGIGLAKEATDARFDRNDMSANMLGAIFGTMAGNQKKILPSWSTTDKKLMQSYAWMNVLDVVQTRHCLKFAYCHEANPLFGKRPSATSLVISKVVATGTIYWIADEMADEWRTVTLLLVNAIQFTVVRHNYF